MRPKTALPNPSLETPAPGHYVLSSTVGRDAPAVSMAGRHPSTIDAWIPGPGAYGGHKVGEVGKDAPAITMAGRPSDRSATEDVPGPGSYVVALRSSAPAVSMQGRHELSVDDWKVAPGTYDVRPIYEGPVWTMAARFPGSSSIYAATTNPMHFITDRAPRGVEVQQQQQANERPRPKTSAPSQGRAGSEQGVRRSSANASSDRVAAAKAAERRAALGLQRGANNRVMVR